MEQRRDLAWDGCFNARDLGGFATRDGGRTRWGSIIRADAMNRLTPLAWQEVEAYGIRSVVDLRNDVELAADVVARPSSLKTVRVEIDDVGDAALWDYIWSNELDGSPLYFRVFLEKKPERCADAVRAIAQAPPGGVVFHCVRGRDRTGLVTLLVLALAGVAPDDIALDYELSADRVRRLEAALGEKEQGSEIAQILGRKGTSSTEVILDLLSSIDVEGQLRKGGLHESDVKALRERFTDHDDADPRQRRS